MNRVLGIQIAEVWFIFQTLFRWADQEYFNSKKLCIIYRPWSFSNDFKFNIEAEGANKRWGHTFGSLLNIKQDT